MDADALLTSSPTGANQNNGKAHKSLPRIQNGNNIRILYIAHINMLQDPTIHAAKLGWCQAQLVSLTHTNKIKT